MLSGVAACVALLIGCAGGPASDGSETDWYPTTGNAALDAALRQETAVPRSGRPHADPDGAYTVELAFPYTHVQEDGGDRFSFEIGGLEGAMACNLGDELGDLGGSAAAVAEVAKTQIGELDTTLLTAVRTGHFGDVPYQGVEWLMVGSQGSAQPKVLSANKHGFSIDCYHLALGQSRTLHRVFQRMVESFEATTPPPKPYLQEITIWQLNGMDVGIDTITLTLDADGDTAIEYHGSMLVPVSQSELSTTTSFERSWASPDGALISSYVAEVEQGEVTTDLQLRVAEDQTWQVNGVFQGKDLAVALDWNGPIDSKLSDYLVLRRELAPQGAQTEVVLHEWSPDLDPTGLTELTIRIDPGDPRIVEVTTGNVDVRGARNADGFIDRGTTRIGPVELNVRTVYRHGDL